MMPEPLEVYPESKFEEAIISAVREIALHAKCKCTVVPRFGLDVAIFLQQSGLPYSRFLEAKSFNAQRPGGVGLGNGTGNGLQVDILLLPESDLRLLDQAVRWILADATKPYSAARYAFFDCAAAKNAVMNNVARGKQNNLRISAFKDQLLTWPQLYDQMTSFLLLPINGI